MAYEKFTGEEYIDTDLVAKLNQDFDACGKLASNNTWTGNNYWNGSAIFNANLTIRGSATTNNVFVIRADDTKVVFSSNNNFFATVTHDGVAKWLGNANTATKLATARTITANLASSTAGSFDGSANITVGVTGTLPIANGGTGATTAAAARTALGCAPAYTYSTTDLTAGSSALTTGTLYIVYE